MKRIDLIKLLLEWGLCWDEDFDVYLRSYIEEERAKVINVLSFYEIKQEIHGLESCYWPYTKRT